MDIPESHFPARIVTRKCLGGDVAKAQGRIRVILVQRSHPQNNGQVVHVPLSVVSKLLASRHLGMASLAVFLLLLTR